MLHMKSFTLNSIQNSFFVVFLYAIGRISRLFECRSHPSGKSVGNVSCIGLNILYISTVVIRLKAPLNFIKLVHQRNSIHHLTLLLVRETCGVH